GEEGEGWARNNDIDDKQKTAYEIDEGRESEQLGKGELEGGSQLSPAFAQALERLNDLARQRLPEPSSTNPPNPTSEELVNEALILGDEEDALEQLQDALVQMMEVVRELAEELSTDALKITS